MNYKQSLAGGFIAFVLATACCWLPALVVVLGGTAGLLSFSESLEKYSVPFMLFGAILVVLGIYQSRKRKSKISEDDVVILQSVITCPNCGAKKEETMPTDACAYFYQCDNCSADLKPKEGDCCVYCSYGSVPCPPIQLDKECC